MGYPLHRRLADIYGAARPLRMCPSKIRGDEERALNTENNLDRKHTVVPPAEIGRVDTIAAGEYRCAAIEAFQVLEEHLPPHRSALRPQMRAKRSEPETLPPAIQFLRLLI